MATCKDCALWKREQATDKAGRVRKDRVAQCLWEPVWAASWYMPQPPVGGRFMPGDGGKGCKQFRPRKQPNYGSAAKNDIATPPNPAPNPHHDAE